ncbi:MAG: histone deacetylase family protein [Candidatus Bathyarchaeia archaeon]
MKIVYHERYREVYASDPAAAAGRIEAIYEQLQGRFEFVTPEKAREEDLKLVHWQSHIDHVKQHVHAYEIALLAVGGAVKAAKLAVQHEPSFALIRPPGHHASQDSSWGFCYFNNIAISIEKLRKEGLIQKALIIDIDLHYGDGTANIFINTPQVTYYHVDGNSSQQYLNNLTQFLKNTKVADIVAVSAGFDRHEQDWGGLLKTEDYATIGRIIKEYSEKTCHGKRYAVLEGGYNHKVLGKNVQAFLEGMK